LSVATESSSHLAGLLSLDAQPWVYAGSGLGNVNEYSDDNQNNYNKFHVCLAGGTSRDSLTFASTCVVSACSASDIYAPDFIERLQTASFHQELLYDELVYDYITVQKRIATVGKYLNTGWVCGEYVIDWELIPSTIWFGIMSICILFTIIGTRTSSRSRSRSRSRTRSRRRRKSKNKVVSASSSTTKKSGEYNLNCNYSHSPSNFWFWSAWDINSHLQKLIEQRSTKTACLDGLKVGSIVWIIAAHVMAIQSSTGAGYSNPQDFLPPNGITTTFFGQLLFSSRYAVDTFLCISGYLAIYVLQRKLVVHSVVDVQSPPPQQQATTTTTTTSMLSMFQKIVMVILYRILRIIPLYMICSPFWMYIAPHLGSGPFWYQWEHFLQPCRELWWTNLLFVNNFWPWGAPTESNCFYHSWYLAVDIQLFCFICCPLIVILLVYQCKSKASKSNSNHAITVARYVTIILWLISVFGTAALAYTNNWSVNSFDGIDVGLFDIEGYSKPHVRAQSYLAGIYVALLPPSPPSPNRKKTTKTTTGGLSKNIQMIFALMGLIILSFITVTGAYARRACTFEESPSLGDDCGSLWSPSVNFLYTAFSRAIWSICIAILMYLCDDDDDDDDGGDDDECVQSVSVTNIVKSILSYKLWTPIAHLSFGAYLIHPIVIYVWFLGGREKITFRIFSYAMDVCSITVVTFAASFIVTILIEFPFGILLQ
ncbi:hypothetical protein FRACYDRAFT_136539, partial [Fragilariopsis cylindrus CCMP1102]